MATAAELTDYAAHHQAWKQLVDSDTVSGVMSAISGLNSIPSAAHKELLTDMLRGTAVSSLCWSCLRALSDTVLWLINQASGVSMGLSFRTAIQLAPSPLHSTTPRMSSRPQVGNQTKYM
jgi:hypothetical protein